MSNQPGKPYDKVSFIETIQKQLIGCQQLGQKGIYQNALRSAAVLIPLFKIDTEWHILYTRRSDSVQDHKGQVAFPGGVVDPGDVTIEDTALREAYEEIGLQRKDVHLLGCTADITSTTNYHIIPVVGIIRWPYQFHLELNEVSRIFGIPVRWLADDRNRQTKAMVTAQGQTRNVIYYQPYDDELLWGITARITVDFLKLFLR